MRRLALTLALCAAIPALAQDTEETAEVPEQPQRFGEVPFEPQLARLLEVMGSVQFLRQLCDADEETIWRERAAALIAAEGETDTRRVRLTAAFNRGYRAFSNYTNCTDSALYAIDQYMREGETISRNILLRYGN